MRYSVLYKALNFNEKDKNGKRSFNKEKFQSYINDEKTKKRISNKRMLGAFSHICRDEFVEYLQNCNDASVGDPSDFLLAKNYACNAITKMYIEGDYLMIEAETLPTEQGEILAKLLDAGYEIPVSISTSLDVDENDEYEICEVFGIDITNSPAFETSVVSSKKIKE